MSGGKEKMKFKYIVIFIAMGGLLALYVISHFSQPMVVSLSSLPVHEGHQVIVEGVVTAYRTTTSGSQIITIRDIQNTTDSVILYLEGTVSVEYGDIVQATGAVQQYKGQWEVIINSPQFVTILQKWGNRSFPLWQLAENPEQYCDTNVNVTGVVSQTAGSSFTLSSPDVKYSIDVFYDISYHYMFSKGDMVMVEALFFYDASTMRFKLAATEAKHGIWKVGR